MIFVADVAVGPMLYSVGLLGGLVLYGLVMLVEAIVLRVLKWADFRRSLRDAAIVNVISTVIGVVVWLGLFNVIYSCQYVPFNDGQHVVRQCSWIVSPFVLLILMCAASVLIEGIALLRLKRHAANETWRAALVANVVSYVVLAPIYFGLLFVMG